MREKNKQLILTTMACLLPLLLGLLFYPKMPDQMPLKWHSDGTTGQYVDKELVLFGVPLGMAALNGFVHFMMDNDPRRAYIGIMKTLMKWLIPVLSCAIYVFELLWGLDYRIRVDAILPAVIGVVFIIAGNYMPKCRRNYTTGIKTPWTLSSDENWRRTHHLAAYLWILTGIFIILLGIFQRQLAFPARITTICVILVMCAIPWIYSFVLYKKGV